MKNKSLNPRLSTVTVGLVGIVCVYYFIYFVLCLLGFDSRLMCLFALFVMMCAALPVLFRKRLKALFGKRFDILHVIFTVALCVYAVSTVIFWIVICSNNVGDNSAVSEKYMTEDQSGADTVIAVFGCRAYGMSPSRTLKARLDSAYELLVKLPDAVCIVSGGQGSDETVPEAVVMYNYLVERGIDGDRIILEQSAHSTSENVRFIKALLEEKGLSDKRVIGVSTAFHLPRIGLLCKRYGLQMEVYSSPSPSAGHFYVSMVREYLSYIKMALFDKAVLITKVT